MLIITGTGRSGTSLLAEFCRRCGHNPGGGWTDAIDAGHEEPETALLHDYLGRCLESCASFDREWALSKITADTRRVLKDTRFVQYPKLIALYAEAFPSLSVVLCLRNFRHVARSRLKMHASGIKLPGGQPEWFDPSKGIGEIAAGAAKHVAEFIVEAACLRVPVSVLHFPTYIDHFDDVRAALEPLEMPENAAEIFASLADRRKVHIT